jgi:hypothetical protein
MGKSIAVGYGMYQLISLVNPFALRTIGANQAGDSSDNRI